MTGRMDELLDEVATYADRLADSEDLADTGSMNAARALAELYEAREWVPEWLMQKPIREHKAYVGGRPPVPDSRNRFAQWQVWKQAQRKRHAVKTMRTYQLLDAHELSTGYLHGVEITSEWSVRPIGWLRKHGFADRIPEVWALAQELVGPAGRVTVAETTQALADWKHETLGAKGVRTAVRTSKAHRDRLRAQTAVTQVFADGDQAEVEAFHKWYVELARASQKRSAA